MHFKNFTRCSLLRRPNHVQCRYESSEHPLIPLCIKESLDPSVLAASPQRLRVYNACGTSEYNIHNLFSLLKMDSINLLYANSIFNLLFDTDAIFHINKYVSNNSIFGCKEPCFYFFFIQIIFNGLSTATK